MLGAADIAHFEHGVAEFNCGVGDGTVGLFGAGSFLGVEGGFQEVEETRDALNNEIWGDVAVPCGEARS